MNEKLMKNQKSATSYGLTATLNLGKKQMSFQIENEHQHSDDFFQLNLPQYYRAILKEFKKVTHSFVTFNLLFFTLFVTEVTLFTAFFSSMIKSSLFAVALGGVFLTVFSYFILLFYFQAKKPEQLHQLKEQFIQSCRQILPIPEGEPAHHLSIAEALSKLSLYLNDFESTFYKVPPIFSPFARLISKFSTICYKEDVFKMKQMLLQASVEEHLRQIRITPTDLEVHASLANTYVTLSKIYTLNLEEKHKQTIRLAMEEFYILSHWAPNDPWVHEQLAASYRELNMANEEIAEIEILLKLKPSNNELLFRLGTLYFSKKMNAKGLQIYEELFKANYKKAEELIQSYGTHTETI